MKLFRLLSVFLFAASGVAFADHDHAHSHGHGNNPMHGGVVTEVKDVDYELVAKSDSLRLHVRDHGQPVDVSKASAKATLLTGAEKKEVEMKPAGAFLEARGVFKTAGTKVVVLVSQPGKPAVTARFVLK